MMTVNYNGEIVGAGVDLAEAIKDARSRGYDMVRDDLLEAPISERAFQAVKRTWALRRKLVQDRDLRWILPLEDHRMWILPLEDHRMVR